MTSSGLATVSIIAQSCFTLGFLWYFYRARVTWMTVFAGMHVLLIGIPFMLFTCHATGLFNIWNYLGPNYEQRYLLSFGNGVRPTCYILLIQAAFTTAAVVTHRLWNRAAKRLNGTSASFPHQSPNDPNRLSRYFVAALLLFVAALGYKIVRMVWLDDLPLLIALRDGIHPKAASMINSVRKDVPYLLLPSIDRQVFLNVLPLTAVAFGVLWQKTNSRINGWLFAASTAASFFFLLAHLKRTPFLLVAIFFVTFAAIYGIRRYRTLAATGVAFALFGLFGMTSIYQIFNNYHQDQPEPVPVTKAEPPAAISPTRLRIFGSKIVTAVASRILVGESVEDYIAVEHIGSDFEHTGMLYVTNYMKRVAGGRCETLAEFWYTRVSGYDNGGSTSLGIFLEAYAAFGLTLAAIVAACMGALLTALDGRTLKPDSWEYHPLIAALVVTVGTMSVKGFFSMFFTGGTLLLLLLAASLYVLFRIPLPAFTSAASPAPLPVGSGQFE